MRTTLNMSNELKSIENKNGPCCPYLTQLLAWLRKMHLDDVIIASSKNKKSSKQRKYFPYNFLDMEEKNARTSMGYRKCF
jgi:hypothetical protein